MLKVGQVVKLVSLNKSKNNRIFVYYQENSKDRNGNLFKKYYTIFFENEIENLLAGESVKITSIKSCDTMIYVKDGVPQPQLTINAFIERYQESNDNQDNTVENDVETEKTENVSNSKVDEKYDYKNTFNQQFASNIDDDLPF